MSNSLRRASGALAALILAGTAAGCSSDEPKAASGPDVTTVTEYKLRPGQTQVTGTATAVRATGAVAPPVPTPFTITVPARGAGGATISSALVGGARSTIVWDGGRPLPVSGQGAIDIGPARLEAGPGTVRWLLDGAPRALTTGTYRLGATVAVGARGLGTPRDGVAFEADQLTALVTKCGARIELRAVPLSLEGPGTVELDGLLRLRTAEQQSREARSARFGEGPFQVKLTPVAGGYQVDALFQAPMSG